MQMQMIHLMQPIQPRLVLQQAVLKQPVVSHVRPAQPWLGQLQLPAQVRPAGPMAPAAMPTPVKHMAKLARPLRWVYAAPMQRTQGRTNQVVLPFQQVVSTKVMAPERKELPKEVSTQVKAPERKELPLIDGQVPKDAGVEGMHPIDFKAFWEQSLLKFLSTCSVLPVGVMGFKRTVHVPAMDLLKEIQKFVEMFLDQPIVAFMCQYSAHRAPTVANFYRKSCPSKQRVIILEGGFRGWEAHDLPIQQIETKLSQKAADQLALKIGKEVSKLTGGHLFACGGRDGDIYHSSAECFQLPEVEVLQVSTSRRAIQLRQLGQNPARPMAMPVAMPVAMPTPIVKAVVKPVVKPSQWIYALLQSTPGRSTRWSSVEGTANIPAMDLLKEIGKYVEGWEAHDLLIQQIETKLSQKACDQLALVGKDVSKLTGWNACDQLAVKIGQSVSKLMAECRVMSSRHSSNACRHQHSAVSIQYHPLVEVGLESPCGVVAEGPSEAAPNFETQRTSQLRRGCGTRRFAVVGLMQMIHLMQPIQPRLVLQQAVLKQPVVSHVRPAQPWLGQLQLPAQVRPAGPMAPAAMPTPVKHMAKLARPLRWVYAAPMQRTQGRTNQVVLPFQQVVSTKVMAPERKELPKEVSTQVKAPERKELPLIDGQVPKDAGVEGMHPIDFKAFWEQSLLKFLSTCSVLPVGVMGFKRTVHVPAMDLLKEIQKFVEMFLDQPIVAFMCQYSAHRAPTVANFYRKSCPSKQRVIILEGGFRGWEAHDLPIQQIETKLSQKAADQLALKIGKEVSKLTGGHLFACGGRDGDIYHSSAECFQLPEVEVLQVSTSRRAIQLRQLGQNPARPMAMPVAMPVAMPTPIVKAVVKPVVKPSQWIYALLQSTPGRSTRWSSVEGSIKVARARSGKRGYWAIPGTANIPAMDLLKEIGKYVEVANFYRKSCQFKQRVMILEGGFRGWEAHDLPIQQIETKLSQKVCDQLALIGKDVSKLTGWNACDQLAVKIGQSVSKLMAECHVMSSRLVLNPLVALWLKGHQKQRPILRRNFPAEVGIFLQYLLSRVLLAMQMIHLMQPIQPRLVLQQAVLKQPVVSHVRPAQPWLGQLQLPAQVRPMAPAAMPTPVKHMAKLARPLRWVYAAPMQRTQGRTNQVVLPFQQVVSTKVMAPERKELPKEVSTQVKAPERKELPLIDGQVPKDAGVEGMHPIDFKAFWEQSLLKFLSTCSVLPVGVMGFKRTVHVPAMDLLKEIQKFVEMFLDQPIVAFMCQYSAHRAPTVANFYRKSCPTKQRVMILEGGFRGWEAHDLPIQQIETKLSQKAADQLALKIGKVAMAISTSAECFQLPEVEVLQVSTSRRAIQLRRGQAASAVACAASAALGRVHQLGQNSARPMAMPVAMPTPIVKAVVKPVVHARNGKYPGHGSPQGDREICGGVWGPADRGIFLPVFEYWHKNATIGWSPKSFTYFPISLRLVLNPLVALWLKGHQKQRPILRRNFPAEVGIFLQYLLSRVLLAVPDAPDGAAALGDADDPPDAAHSATLGAAAGRAQAASGVACAASAAVAWAAAAASSGEARPMAPAAMPTPVKHMAKLARPLRWVYAAPMQRTQGRTNQVVLPFQQVVSTKVMAPERKELPKEVSTQVKAPERKELPLIDGQVPKDAGVEGMHPIDFKAFWEQSLFKFLSTCSVLPVGVMGFKRTVHVPAMDLLKEIQKFVEMFLDQPIVAFMCQYSAHRAPTVANFYRKSCPSKQRVIILEGGFRGWEAHDLPIQQIETKLSQKAADQLALKIGKEVSKLTGGHLFACGGRDGDIYHSSAECFQLPEVEVLQVSTSRRAIQLRQLGQNPARPMAMPVAMPVAMPTPIVKAVVKPVVKPSQWIYALLQSTPGRSTRWSSVEGSIKVARARSGKRGYWAIPGTANIPAMDLLKEIGKYVEVANFYRKSCQSRQRVMILEGGFRGWEAHDLPIQQIETKLSQKVCDQLALIGKDVSKLTGWNACDQLAVKIGQSVSKLMAECHVMSSRHSSNACRHQHSAVSIQYHPLVEANIASPTTRRRMARSM
ncbi:unnamed protein product [Cladocopium goreaui]|uniref:Ubiquitin domain-containing protein DSK2b n=1 Tax=Cladocopium goreaui TaxID=2562237 RepID=A0A9P1BL14_9DINO|nr:unnamed protein product [Cladocopium goreaui]